MPSQFESLSMVALEAWALGKPVLANGRCDVLRGPVHPQQRRPVLRDVRRVRRGPVLARGERAARRAARPQRPEFFQRHYTWPVIERKYLEMFERLKREPARRQPAWSRCPASSRAGAAICPPAREIVDAACRPDRLHERRGRGPSDPRDARLWRRDRARSARHPPRAARRRLRLRDHRRDRRPAPRGRDDRLPRHGRRAHAGRSAHPSFFAWIARVADGVRAALPDGARLPQHHAAGVLPRRARSARAAVLSRPARAAGLSPRCDLALGDSEFNRQELEPLGFPAPACCRSCPTSRISTSRRPRMRRAYDDDWTNILFVGRMVPNKRPDNLIRIFHAYKTLFNPRSRLILAGPTAASSVSRAAARAGAPLGTPRRAHPRTGHDEELTALYDVADVFLCASEHEGFCVPIIEAFHKRVPVIAYAATAVPATMDGGGCCTTTTDPRRVAASSMRLSPTQRSRMRDPATPKMRRCAAAGARLRRRRCSRLRRRAAGAAAHPRPTSRTTSGGSSNWPKSSRRSQERPSAFRALPPAPEDRACRRSARDRVRLAPRRGDRHGRDDRPSVDSGGASRRRDRRHARASSRSAARLGHDSESTRSPSTRICAARSGRADEPDAREATSRSSTLRCRRR